MDEDIKMPNRATGSTTAVSLFGGDAAAGDFPVLKAFQEYIDAEQAKARKRMLGLSIFFVVLLVVVVVTFVMVLMFMTRQNQSLSDRLLDLAFKQHPAQQAPSPSAVQHVPEPAQVPAKSAAEDVALRTFIEKMEKVANDISEAAKRKSEPAPAQINQAVASPGMDALTARPSPVVVQPAPQALVSEEERVREQLRRQREELMKIREEAKAEKERLRQEVIERQRRKLYPEHYAREDARKEAEKRRKEVPAMSYFDKADEDDDLAEIARLAKEARAKESREKSEAAAEAARIKAAAEADAERIRAAAAKKAAATEEAAQRKAAEVEAAAKRKAAAIEAEESAKRKAAAIEAEESAKRKAAAIEAEESAKRKAESGDGGKVDEAAAKTRVEKIEVNTKGDAVVPLLIPPVE